MNNPKHWWRRALFLLVLVAASCSVPSFQFGNDPSGTAAHCENLISDEGETGVDCGGTCPACPTGATCVVNNDCLGNQCMGGVCQDESCLDSMLSGNESDKDCGGGGCPPCTPGRACLSDRDCTSSVCSNGTCAEPSCKDQVVNGDETDSDCGGSCPTCLPGQKCKRAGDCSGGDCTLGACSLSCLDGRGDCDGNLDTGCETNLKTAADHCGACDTPCDLAHAVARCSGGKCAVDGCTPPFEDCDGDPANGCETNTGTDTASCSGCGLACPAVNGTPACVAAACQISCNAGYADCDDDRANGCEKKIDGDATNCGACGKVCDAANGTPRCNLGVCGVSDCPPGFGDCDGDPKNGCEIDLTKDADNCKACGSGCVVANGSPSCVASACKVGSCDANHADCNGIFNDGCEANIVSDAKNCGTCAKTCSVGNGTAKCEDKQCKVSACTPPWADCDGNGTDCETNTGTNGANCGGCGANGLNCNAVYGALNATGKCVASACQLDKCAAKYADCNTNPDADGCETNLTTASNNCGSCGSVCQAPHGANNCSAGSCVPNCGSGFGDCDGDVKTGCEAVLASDPNNCGACGTVCLPTNASNLCVAGACSPTCSQSYFKSCDGNPDNGCEVDTRGSKTHCGACGSACVDNHSSSNNCSAGACAPVCLANFASCDGNSNNGCETGTSTDSSNCGACGVVCKTENASTSSCSAGVCNPICNNGFAACGNPTAGCQTSLDTAAHCGNCATSCSGATPFCVARACAARLNIAVVNSNTLGKTSTVGQTLVVPHALQTSLASNAYRLVVVGITGFGNNAASLPTSVQYNGIDMTLAKVIAPTNQLSAVIYYLRGNALPAAAGTYNVIVNSAGTNSFLLTANVLEFINVEQATSPIDAVGGQANNNTCMAHTPSDTVNVSAVGDFIYSIAGVSGPVSDANPNLTGQTITEQASLTNMGTIAGYLKAPATGLRTITWALANCSSSVHALISLKPALTP